MNAHRETDHVQGFLYVRFPVAALLSGFEVGYFDVVVLVSVRVHHVLGEKHFAGVLHAGEVVYDFRLEVIDNLLLFRFVGGTGSVELLLPEVGRELHEVLEGCGILEFAVLCDGNEAFDVVPFASDDGCVFGYGVEG